MPRTSAIRHKAGQGEGNTRITQDVVGTIRVLASHSCAMSFAIKDVCTNILDGCGCFYYIAIF